MKAKQAMINFGLAAFFLVVALLCRDLARAADGAEAKKEDVPVKFKRIRNDDYQNFLRNWDDKTQSVLFAQIQTYAQYQTLFHGCPVMGENRPYGPDVKLFDTEQILVVGHVIGDTELYFFKIFDVVSLVERDQNLELHYRFNPPSTKELGVKDWLAIRIPKHDYKKVVFFENGKKIGELNTGDKQWSIPAMEVEPR